MKHTNTQKKKQERKNWHFMIWQHNVIIKKCQNRNTDSKFSLAGKKQQSICIQHSSKKNVQTFNFYTYNICEINSNRHGFVLKKDLNDLVC